MVGAATWTFSGAVGARITNASLLLGGVALVGALYAVRPVGRPREPEAVPGGLLWAFAWAGSVLFHSGPAWIVATGRAMHELTPLSYGAHFAAAWVGVAVAVVVASRLAARMPEAAPTPGRPVAPATRVLAAAYAGAAVLTLAGWLG